MEDSDRLSALRTELVNRLGRDRYDLWIGQQTTLEFAAVTLRVGCPTPFEVQFLRRRLHSHLLEGGTLVAGKEFAVEYFVRPAPPAESNCDQPVHLQQDLFESEQGTKSIPTPASGAAARGEQSRLHQSNANQIPPNLQNPPSRGL